ncbi:PREDICTED: protein DEFECTIVE IN MERISTEM SILENCING 3 [Theobroma cacao]|uniref:Protein DEFECTIVE IN MERISTEM SILENCING 3 n=1 Tax=Theobroma cacao TaxID=3641 RepID=A0AB32W2J3_THECC|nr:PREDICTED: protein DEFECTIVE IN MERISTEM SILENCING 3 [Theobroma cacao]
MGWPNACLFEQRLAFVLCFLNKIGHQEKNQETEGEKLKGEPKRHSAMFSSNHQFPNQPKPLAVMDPTTPMQVDQNEASSVARDEMRIGGFSHAKSIIQSSEKLQDDLRMLGLKIKHHEDNIKLLKIQKNKLDDSILDMQVMRGKYHSSSAPKIGNENCSHLQSEEETTEQILRHGKSAAGILCQLKIHNATQASYLTLTRDVLGAVATLGKVDDENLSWLFSEYLGVQTMMAIVCKTYESVRALETYNQDGCIDKTSGLHRLGASIGRAIDGRFHVICLESLRPYAGDFVADDPQRRLDLLKPRLPNGECPPGFLGFAVNMIQVDSSNLFCVTASGDGLRETLFYNLFSRLQVYRTRAEMVLALPCISEGAVSLDGGMIRSSGVFSFGNREEVDVRFPKPSAKSDVPQNYIETEKQMKEMTWRKEKLEEDMKREQALLDNAKFNFERKKQDFVKFLAQSSSFATQFQATQDRLTPR